MFFQTASMRDAPLEWRAPSDERPSKLRLHQQHVRAVGTDGDLDLVLALERDAVAARQGRLGDVGLAFEHEGIEAVCFGRTVGLSLAAVAQQARDAKSLADRPRARL